MITYILTIWFYISGGDKEAYELMEPKAGETIFISGGTGSLLSQGHSFGKEVWFKSNHQWKRKSEERVRKLGADIFIDYRKEDYSLVLKDVDYVLDTLGERELNKEFSLLKKEENLFLFVLFPTEILHQEEECP